MEQFRFLTNGTKPTWWNDSVFAVLPRSKTTVIERSGIGLFSYQDPEVKHSAYCFVISVKSDQIFLVMWQQLQIFCPFEPKRSRFCHFQFRTIPNHFTIALTSALSFQQIEFWVNINKGHFSLKTSRKAKQKTTCYISVAWRSYAWRAQIFTVWCSAKLNSAQKT